jgi:hypothetical protein
MTYPEKTMANLLSSIHQEQFSYSLVFNNSSRGLLIFGSGSSLVQAGPPQISYLSDTT